MRFELKSIVFSERMSEETNAFVANLYVDGKKLCSVRNDGQGGNTNYYVDDFKNSNYLKEVETYCRLLPPIEYHDSKLDNNLEMVIDQLFEDWMGLKELKKLENNFNKGICYGTTTNYAYIKWGKNTIPFMLNDVKGREMVRNKIIQLRKEGETILNTNLPKEFLV